MTSSQSPIFCLFIVASVAHTPVSPFSPSVPPSLPRPSSQFLLPPSLQFLPPSLFYGSSLRRDDAGVGINALQPFL